MFSLEDIRRYVTSKYRPEGLIVDTNILILFLIGSYDPNLIGDIKVLKESNKNYSVNDFDLLKKIFAYFKKVVITPQVIAEISNISITRNGGMYGEKIVAYLRVVIMFLKSVEERHQRADCLWEMELKTIGQFGFTDMTMFELSNQTKMPILTDDFPFFQYSTGKIPIIKFEDIKNQGY